MVENLIYVFNEKDKEMLEKLGWLLLKEDKSNCTFIFHYDGKTKLTSLEFVGHVILTNSLSF